MRIRFDVPADPAYPGRVAAVLSGVRLRRFGRIGTGLTAVGLIGLVVSQTAGWGERGSAVSFALILVGLLSLLYAPWVRWRSRRRSSGYAVEGGYEITENNIVMRSGTESGGIAWDGVDRVEATPEFWIVYVGHMPATVIPRRYLTAGDAERLRTFMAERGLLRH